MQVTARDQIPPRSRRWITAALAMSATLAVAWTQSEPSSNEPSSNEPSSNEPSSNEQVALRVLYVGSPDSSRTADFLTFLRQEFTVVGQASYPDFQPEEADPYDVVIFDVEMHPTERSIGIGKQPTLPKDWARATVLVNGPGVILADRQLGAKLDWF